MKYQQLISQKQTLQFSYFYMNLLQDPPVAGPKTHENNSLMQFYIVS